MNSLTTLIGRELGLEEVARHLYGFASRLNAPVVGAIHVTCSDESERECVDVFQRSFAEYLLPSLKFGERSPFRIANLGGRYEWNAIRIADAHYSTAAAMKGFKLLVVKVNSHVSVESSPRGPRFGQMRRYDTGSAYCGALHALLEGAQFPFTADLHEALASEGKDRLAILRDEEKVDPSHRSLFIAVASARLQARRALVDIQDRRLKTPTLCIVLPCVTLNRKLKDGEIVCGMYIADWRSEKPTFEYQGLGDDPAAFRLSYDGGRVFLEDDEIGKRRPARDHRELVVKQWSKRAESPGKAESPGVRGKGADRHEAEAKLDDLMNEAAEKKHHTISNAKPLLKTLLHTLALFDPVSAVVLLFGEGLLGVHHHHQIHTLSRGQGANRDARQILDAVHTRIDGLPPERARAVVDFLHAHLRPRR